MSNEENYCAPSCCNDSETKRNNVIEQNALHKNVREMYTKVATATDETGCGNTAGSCCGTSDDTALNALISTRLGYSQAKIDLVPEGADMGLGCGNPKVMAALQEGEVVVDLGSGGGFDCFLASPLIGKSGKIIGIDMTPDMISKARKNTEKGRFTNVEFRLGEIENIPVADNTVDVIISNCVINLSPDKAQVFKEAFRILKSGGRLAISDVVASIELPDEMRNNPLLIAGCMGNAALIKDLENDIRSAGFTNISIKPKDTSRDFIKDWAPGISVENYVVSATIEATKP